MKVLVIDDNKDLTEAIYDSLDSPDIECTMINDGKAGLDEILKERGKYNLILLDIAMPNFSGMDVLRTLKKEDLLCTSGHSYWARKSAALIITIISFIKYIIIMKIIG
jgi:DNA-binding response OmpR family regulator